MLNEKIRYMEDKVATRETIAEHFGTDDLTTHRILMNLNYGFFISHFADNAEKMWEDAHPFFYQSNSKNYSQFSINFIEKHFELFSKRQFCTGAGWEYNPKIDKMEWTYKTGYRTV